MKKSVIAAVVGIVAAVAGTGFIAWGPLELGERGELSENHEKVVDDKSWLGYLPVPRGDVEPKVTGLQVADSETEARRVDVLVEPSGDSIALCFAASEDDAERACGGAVTVVGQTDRDVDLPWVAQLGQTEVDLLEHLQAPIPRIEDVPSLEE